MTSSNGNIFRVTGPLSGESTGQRCFPSQRPVTRGFDVFFNLSLNKRMNNGNVCDLRRYRVHYDVTVMTCTFILFSLNSLWTCGEICPWYDWGTSSGILVKRRVVSDHHGIHIAWQILLRTVRYAHLCGESWVIIVSMISKMRNFIRKLVPTRK